MLALDFRDVVRWTQPTNVRRTSRRRGVTRDDVERALKFEYRERVRVHLLTIRGN